MGLNSNTSPDGDWTGVLRVNPKTNNEEPAVVVAAGVRLPSLTTAERDALAEVEEGTIIYNTTTSKLNFRTSSAWEAVTSA